MRACQVAGVLMLLAWAGSAAAAPCQWADTRGWPVLSARGPTVYFQHAMRCPGEAKGSYEVTFFAGDRQVTVEKGTIKPHGRWLRDKRLDERLAPSQYCEDLKPGKPLVGRASNGVDDRLVFEVPIRAEIKATGDLAGLESTFQTTARCGACDGYRSYETSMMIKDGRAGASSVKKGVRMVAEVQPAWFACARRLATLEVRYFAGNDRDEVMRAIRPDVVQTGLAKGFKTTGKKARLDVPVPVAALCKTGKTLVSWEAAGTGELQRISGGGRSLLKLSCKR